MDLCSLHFSIAAVFFSSLFGFDSPSTKTTGKYRLSSDTRDRNALPIRKGLRANGKTSECVMALHVPI